MAAEAIRYSGNLPLIQDGLKVDREQLLGCPECEAVYRVHFSDASERLLSELRFQAGDKISSQHPDHHDSIFLG